MMGRLEGTRETIIAVCAQLVYHVDNFPREL